MLLPLDVVLQLLQAGDPQVVGVTENSPRKLAASYLARPSQTRSADVPSCNADSQGRVRVGSLKWSASCRECMQLPRDAFIASTRPYGELAPTASLLRRRCSLFDRETSGYARICPSAGDRFAPAA